MRRSSAAANGTSSTAVERKKKQDIDITFRPDKERPYDIVVLLDMIGIGFDMLTLPVSGICEVPEVEITPMELLDFGNVYLKQEVALPIKLHNTSSLLSTQFKINKQDEQSKEYGILIFYLNYFVDKIILWTSFIMKSLSFNIIKWIWI